MDDPHDDSGEYDDEDHTARFGPGKRKSTISTASASSNDTVSALDRVKSLAKRNQEVRRSPSANVLFVARLAVISLLTTTGTRKAQWDAIKFTFTSVWSISPVANTTIDIFHYIVHISFVKVVRRVATSRRFPSNNFHTRGEGTPTFRIRHRTRELP